MSISAVPYTAKVHLKYPDESWDGPFVQADGLISVNSPYHDPLLSGAIGQYVGFQDEA